MKQALALVALLSIVGCKKDPAQADPALEPDFAAEEKQAEPTTVIASGHPADHLAEVAEPKVRVSEALVLKYLDYRKQVVVQGRNVVKAVTEEQAAEKKDTKLAGSVRAKLATDGFVTRMRDLEEAARQKLGLSRDEVVAVGQVVGEVLSARQIWKRSGGDEAVQKARAELAVMPEGERKKAQARLEERARGFADMRDAKGARARFGDAAVDAVLAHEDALWNVQREGAAVMSAVY